MGMTSSLYAVDEARIDALRADPGLVWELIDPDDAVDDDTADGDAQGVLQADLDKAWHGIHYLLTGSAWEGEAPLGFLLHGGEPLGEEDDYDAPPRAFTAAEVGEIDAALRGFDAARLRARFDPQAMQALDIYPNVWDRGEEELDYCLHYFGELQSFLAEATRRRFGMLVFIG